MVTLGAATDWGITEESAISDECPIYEYSQKGAQAISDGVVRLLEAYHSDESNNVTLGNLPGKARSAARVMSDTRCSLIEIEPWFVNKHMGDDEFDRWEPFCVGQIESSVADRQLKVTQLAPLSEVSYRLSHTESTDSYPDAAANTHYPNTAPTLAQYDALTRYRLSESYNGDGSESPEKCGARIDMNAIRAIHVASQTSTGHLIVGRKDDDTLYCGRGRVDDDQVDIHIGLGWRTGEYGEQKVAVYNDRSTKTAMTDLSWQDTHARYLGEKHRWEVDLNSLKTVLSELLDHETVRFVSLHNATEQRYIHTHDTVFANLIDGYQTVSTGD